MTETPDNDAMRLFVALPVPLDAARALLGLPQRGLTDARWSHPGDLHVTLRFLGDLENPDLEALTEALSRVRRPAFTVEVRGLDVFDLKRQSVLYAKVENVRRVTTLCADVTDVLTPLGFDFGMRPFVPHITLARVGNTKGLGDYCRMHSPKTAVRWRADHFELMRSGGRGEAGRRYRTIARFRLD